MDRLGSEGRLQALARGYGEIEMAQAAAERTAKQFNLSQTEANTAFAKLYGRLRPLGLSVEQIEDAYGGLSTAVKTASLDAAGAAALFTQVSQALGSGVVQAEELNTVIDQSPLIVVALAKELGVTAGEIKKLASDGEVSSEALYRALLRVKDEGVEVLAKSLDGPSEKIKAFYNTTEDIVSALTVAVIPELVDAVADVRDALEALIPLAQVVGRVLAAAFKLAAIPAKGFGDLLANISQGNWDEVLKFDISGLQKLGDIWSELFAPLPAVGGGSSSRRRTNLDFPKIQNRNGDGSGSGKGSGSSKGSRASDKADREAEREAERTAKKLKDQEQLLARLEQQLKIASQITELDKMTEELNLDILEIEQQYVNAVNGETNALILANAERQKALELELARKEAMPRMMDAANNEFSSWFRQQPEHAKMFNEELTETEELLKGSYEIIANGLTSSIKGLIAGTKEWGDVLSDILGQLGQMFLRAGFNGLGAGLGVPGFEGGGYTGNGPRVGGIDGRGGSLAVVHPDETIVDHRSPMGRYNGGNSMSNGGGPLTINFQSHVINNVEYVTKQEAVAMSRAAADDGAKRGTQGGYGKTMKSLQNSRSQRAKLGMS